MKLLWKAAVCNSKHFVLIIFALISMVLLTVGSQMEMFSLGIIAKSSPDVFTLFGDEKNTQQVSLDAIQEKWPEIASDQKTISREDAHRYIVTHKKGNLLQQISFFLDQYLGISSKLSRLAFFLVSVALFKALALFYYRFCNQLIAIRVSRDLRQKYFEHIQSLPMSFYHRYDIGTLSTRVVGDASVIASSINSMLVNYFQAPFAVISTFIACLSLSWKLSIVIFIGFPAIVLPIVYIAKKIKIIATQMQRNQEGFASVLLDFLSGIHTVKIFATEEYSLQRYKHQNQKMAKLEEKSAKYSLASRPILHAVASMFFAGVILIGFYVFHVEPAEVLTFCGLLYVLYEPIKKFAEEHNQMLRGIVAAERMYEVMDLKPTILDAKDALNLQDLKRGITFDNVDFRYHNKWVLKKVSFKITKGEAIAIVGPTGAGKSTIASLLPRLYELENGDILIDDLSIKQYTQKSLRDSIAFVPQKPFLFLDTVYNNLTFGKNYSKEAVLEACRQAHALEFIEKLPGQFDFLLEEGGKNLSGGQAQRLAIARALLKKAPILLMDEATSSLDGLSEGKIKDVIFSLKGKTTQIIIAHRLSTIEHVDRILYLDQGEKVQEGTKEHLLKHCPAFKALWDSMNLGLKKISVN